MQNFPTYCVMKNCVVAFYVSFTNVVIFAFHVWIVQTTKKVGVNFIIFHHEKNNACTFTIKYKVNNII